MVSFRRDQFWAILMGLLIADAVSHRQLSWPLGAIAPPTVTPTLPPSRTALPQDWPRQLVNALSQPWCPTRTGLPPAVSLCDLLVTLPDWLPTLEPAPGNISALAALPPEATRPELSGIDQVVLALLNQQIASLCPPLTVSAAADDELAQLLGLALEIVLSSQGVFGLCLGQSLYHPYQLAGLPLLSSLLSASWRGSRGLSMAACQAVLRPTPALQEWLQARWGLPSPLPIDSWATHLWQRWMGRDPYCPRSPDPALPMAILPVR